MSLVASLGLWPISRPDRVPEELRRLDAVAFGAASVDAKKVVLAGFVSHVRRDGTRVTTINVAAGGYGEDNNVEPGMPSVAFFGIIPDAVADKLISMLRRRLDGSMAAETYAQEMAELAGAIQPA